MARESLTDDQVEQEIARLRGSEAVKLAFKYEAYQYKRRQYLYALRQKEKKGLQLMRDGVSLDNLEGTMQEDGESC